MCIVLEIAGVIVGIIGVGLALWEWHKRTTQRDAMFYFLRGVKTSAEGNAKNTGDTSAAWRALLNQIDDINKRLEKK